MKFDVIKPDKFYIGMTRLSLGDQRSLACMGTGPEVERAIKDRLRELQASTLLPHPAP